MTTKGKRYPVEVRERAVNRSLATEFPGYVLSVRYGWPRRDSGVASETWIWLSF
jgi:hypothetical protein